MNIYNLLNGEITQSDLLNHYNANITYKRMPIYIEGFVFQIKGIFHIIINENLSYYRRKKTILHELAHIELNHLEQVDKDMFDFKINQYEDEVDGYINFLIKNIEVNL